MSNLDKPLQVCRVGRFCFLRVSNGDIGIVTILSERMHQIDRFREDFELGSGRA